MESIPPAVLSADLNLLTLTICTIHSSDRPQDTPNKTMFRKQPASDKTVVFLESRLLIAADWVGANFVHLT